MFKSLKLLLIAILVIFVGNLYSASGNDLPIINKIKVHFNKFQNASEEAVFAHIKIYDGQVYDQSMVSESIRSLYATQLYQLIRIQAEPLPDNKIDITFVIDPKPRIAQLSIQGNCEVSTKRLLKEIKSKVEGPVDESSLHFDVLAIKEYYYKRGFSNTEIRYEIVTDENLGKATVCFVIEEGIKTQVESITFCGHEPCCAKDLLELMRTKEWSILSYITGKGRFREDVLHEDIELIRDYYRNQGYLDVEIGDSDIEIVQKGCLVYITINIKPGKQYRVGTICMSDNKRFQTERLMTLLKIKEGDVFSPALLEASEEALRKAYGELGYLDSYAVAERKPNMETGAIDLEFVIHESGKVFVESITIRGNTKTKSNVILRELALAPGDVFDLVRMESSERRLQNTRFFENVSLVHEETNIPGRRNLSIAVNEGRTGNLQFSITFSSLELWVGQVEVSQSNFDITNYKHGFQGAGQKFRIKARYGRKTNEVEISFEEPWVCERELAFGVSLFRSEAKYYSSEYNELQQGVLFYLRKRLFGLVDGQFSYTLEEIGILDVKKHAAKAIRRAKGKHTVSKLGLAFSFDTRDEIIYPTCGTNILFNTEVAGGPLLGSSKYVKMEATAAQWIPLFDCGKQTLLVGGSTGTIMPYGGKKIYFYDKFFLGGPDTLRGFEFRDVGPKEKVRDHHKKKHKKKHHHHHHWETVGGDTMARFTIEYSVKVLENVRFVTFYDWGFVNKMALNWSPGNYNDDWGIGLRFFILNAPMRLDYAFPLKGDKHNFKKKGLFNFSFGTTF
ncbi:MAG: outer membrane protein assembly factor BamA [Verrucomicrobia bacterium]|nr:MAG: outer membrane protein assembly factor BamA [Verrucomicrobiota bacterium]